MRLNFTVRTLPWLAAFGLFVLASLGSRPLPAAQTRRWQRRRDRHV